MRGVFSMNPSPRSNDDVAARARMILTLRVIWFALLAGEVMFAAVVAFLISSRPPAGAAQPVLTYASFGILLAALPVTFTLRRSMFRRADPAATGGGAGPGGGRVPPATAYFGGNVLFWASCEGVVFLAIVAALINATFWPTIVAAGVAVALQLATFPTAMKLDALGRGGARG
jgi:hypothetical protein